MAPNPALAAVQAARQAAAAEMLENARKLVGTSTGEDASYATEIRLVESQDSGYVLPPGAPDGRPVYTKLVTVFNGRLEKATGYDFYLMALAAEREGVTIRPGGYPDQIGIRCFRTLQQQRAVSAARKKKENADRGQATDPDKDVSNHQKGLAVDIDVGISRKSEYIRDVGPIPGKVTPQWRWLKKNAHLFGFSHTEGNNIREAWHWVHTADEKIYGLNVMRGVRLPSILPTQLAAYSVAVNTDAVTYWYVKDALSTSQAAARSESMRSAGRDAYATAAVADGLRRRGEASAKAAAMHRSTSAGMRIPRVDLSQNDTPTYNEKTGLWE